MSGIDGGGKYIASLTVHTFFWKVCFGCDILKGRLLRDQTQLLGNFMEFYGHT